MNSKVVERRDKKIHFSKSRIEAGVDGYPDDVISCNIRSIRSKFNTGK